MNIHQAYGWDEWQSWFALFVFARRYGEEDDVLRIVNLTKTCAACEKKTIFLQRCGACRSTWYCNKACAKLGWKAGHKEACRVEVEE